MQDVGALSAREAAHLPEGALSRLRRILHVLLAAQVHLRHLVAVVGVCDRDRPAGGAPRPVDEELAFHGHADHLILLDDETIHQPPTAAFHGDVRRRSGDLDER